MTRTFGAYGGRYVPETLIPALDELDAGWRAAQEDEAFARELQELYTSYGGRPTPLTLAPRFAPEQRVYLKREDLLHTGAHKLNNAVGQALLAQRLRERRASQPRPSARDSALTASSTWAPKTCAASARTSSACVSSAPRCGPSGS